MDRSELEHVTYYYKSSTLNHFTLDLLTLINKYSSFSCVFVIIQDHYTKLRVSCLVTQQEKLSYSEQYKVWNYHILFLNFTCFNGLHFLIKQQLAKVTWNTYHFQVFPVTSFTDCVSDGAESLTATFLQLNTRVCARRLSTGWKI